MDERPPARLPWALFAVAATMVAAALLLSTQNGSLPASVWGSEAVVLSSSVAILAFSLVGALIASRQPRNAVGWISLAIGLAVCVTNTAPEYASYAAQRGAVPAGEFAGWLGNFDYLLSIGLLTIYLPLLFPDGRLLSSRWRIVAWLGGAGLLVTAICSALRPGGLQNLPDVQNPVGAEGAEDLLATIEGFAFVLAGLCILASIASVILRFRRAPRAERQQIKWFAYAAVVMAVVFLPVAVFDDQRAGVEAKPGLEMAQDIASLSFAVLPVAVGIAILRHRLYDIDVVVNRTLVYGALTATLAGAYLSGVLVLQLALSGVTQGSGLAVAGSTLAVAALFRPARARIQSTVDRRFFRSRYDAALTLDAFSARLRDEVDIDTVGADLRGVVEGTFQPTHTSLWLRERA